jgi:hypothetical protein
MKIKQMKAAAVLPAAVAGLALSACGAASGASGTGHSATSTGHSATSTGHSASDTARTVSRRPAHEQRWVTVRAGQTLAGIADAHDLSWEALYATPPNMHLVPKPSDLATGDRLRIPENPRFRAGQFTIKYAPAMLRKHELRAFASDRARSGPARREHHASTEPATAGASSTGASATGASATGASATGASATGTASTGTASTGQSLTSGMSSFEECVAWRESGDTPTDPDGLFGILPSTWAELGYSGTAGQASVALQKMAFNRLYAEYGAQPWAPSDGC